MGLLSPSLSKEEVALLLMFDRQRSEWQARGYPQSPAGYVVAPRQWPTPISSEMLDSMAGLLVMKGLVTAEDQALYWDGYGEAGCGIDRWRSYQFTEAGEAVLRWIKRPAGLKRSLYWLLGR